MRLAAALARLRPIFSPKIGLLTALYFAQGLPFGFFTEVVPVLLRERGTSLPKIGLSSLLALPWALKFLWAPAVDRVGRRKSWVVALQAIAVAILAGLGLLADELAHSLTPLLVATFLVNLAAATQDIATDGWAVDLLTPAERGLGNAIQVAAYRIGMIAGGGAILVFIGHLGFAGAFFLMAGLVALTTVPALVAREAPRAERVGAGPAPGPHFALLPGAAVVLLLDGVYKLGESLGVGMLRPFLTDLGLTLDEIAWVTGVVGFVAGLLGALAGGAATTWLGRRRALLLCGLFQTLGTAGYALVGEKDMTLLTVVCALSHFATGTATVSLFTAMMDWCRPAHAASDYTVQASTVVVATGAMSTVSGLTAQALGFRGHFLTAAALSLVGAVVAWTLFPAGARLTLATATAGDEDRGP